MPKSDKPSPKDNQQRHWRAYVGVSPELEALKIPKRSGAEREAAFEDLQARGFNVPVIGWRPPAWVDDRREDCLIDADAIDRLDIAEEKGLLVIQWHKDSPRGTPYWSFYISTLLDEDGEEVLKEIQFRYVHTEPDIFAAIAECNLGKVRWTRAEQRNIRYRYIVANPNKTDRQLARLLGCDHTTVGDLRNEGIRLGEIPQSVPRVGRDGRTYTAYGSEEQTDQEREVSTEKPSRSGADEQQDAERDSVSVETPEVSGNDSSPSPSVTTGEAPIEVPQSVEILPPIGSTSNGSAGTESEKRLTPKKALALSKSAGALAELIRKTPEAELAAQLATIDGADRDKFLRALPCAWWDRIQWPMPPSPTTCAHCAPSWAMPGRARRPNRADGQGGD
jgi:hypothetical protein